MLARPATARQRACFVCWGALLLALGGCGQPPAFEVYWEIHDDDTPVSPPLISQQCSAVGIFSVRVTVEQAGVVLSREEHPCFGGAAEGPPLEPGEYTIEVEGLRRNGQPWAFDPETQSETERIAYDTETVTVSEGALPVLDVTLLAPPECDDGIDNDLDGTVDDRDPGCEIETANAKPLESNDAELTLFQLSVTFLDSPAVLPYNVGVHSIELAVDGEVLATIPDYELDLSQSPFRLPLLSGEFEPDDPTTASDDYTYTVTAIGAGGPVTTSLGGTFSVPDGSGTYVIGQFDFGSEQFLEPIVEPIALLFDPDCQPGGSLTLERMWIRVVDESDQPLDTIALGLTGSAIVGGSATSIMPVDEAGGWISFECPSSIVRSNQLPWGHYEIEVHGRRGADKCYASPQIPLAPQPVSAQTIALERELIDGAPVCPECTQATQNADCGGSQVCEGGLCVDKEPGQ